MPMTPDPGVNIEHIAAIHKVLKVYGQNLKTLIMRHKELEQRVSRMERMRL